MRIGSNPHLCRSCASTALFGHKFLNCSPSGQRARHDGQFGFSGKACADCEARRDAGQQNTKCDFITERHLNADLWCCENAKWNGDQDSGGCSDAASCGGSFGVED